MSPRQTEESGPTLSLSRLRVTGSQVLALVLSGFTLAGTCATSAWWLAGELAAVREEVVTLRLEVGPMLADHGARIDAIERALAGGR